jgi:hypothetical protein
VISRPLDPVEAGEGELLVGLELLPASGEGVVAGTSPVAPPHPAMTTAITANATRRLMGCPTGSNMKW